MQLTSASRFSIARGDVGPFEFGLDAAGLNSWSLNDAARTRPIPATRGLLAVQLLSTRDGAIGFTIDDNATTAPLFFLRSGAEFSIRIWPSGRPGPDQVVMVGKGRVNLTNAEGGARSYRVDITATSVAYGAPAEDAEGK